MKSSLLSQRVAPLGGLAFWLLVLACQCGYSQLNYLTSTEGGSSYEVCLSGNLLYVGAANTLKVFTISGPNHTPTLNTYTERLPSNIDQILVRDGFLYVCANHAGLWKYDLNNAPAHPDFITKFVPANIHESIYDVAFHGDSVVVAAKNKVLLLSDSANALTLLSTVTSLPQEARAHGVDIKGNMLAYTVGFATDTSINGVYLVDLSNLQQLGFYRQTQGAGWEVYFGENNNLLHVMCGQLLSNRVNGIYYAVDYTIPSAMQLQILDTIEGFLPSLAMPMSAVVIHDTVYIATQGAVDTGYVFLQDTLRGYVHVYDATDPNDIHFIEDLYAGLYHFDIDIDQVTKTMYVASEWYGILTVDISNLSNEVSHGKTLTGGWCHGSAFARNRLVEASEGYGVRLFSMDVRQEPTLIKEDTTVGFCRAISMTDSAEFIYAWHLTNKQFRVYDGQTLALLADTNANPSTPLANDYQKSRIHGDYVAVIENVPVLLIFETSNILVANVQNPMVPFVEHIYNLPNLQDLLFHPSGKLFAMSLDSILVFDPVNMTKLAAIAPQSPLFQDFKAMTYSKDTLYVFYQGLGEGIARYYVDPNTFTLTYYNATNYPMVGDHRIFMATNDTVLYISSTLDELKAISILPPHGFLAAYDHSADHVYDKLWGVHDLYYAQGLLVLNEYMGQSSLFGAPTFVAVTEQAPEQEFEIYPNPASGEFALRTNRLQGGEITVYDLNGRRRFSKLSVQNEDRFSTQGWETGIYFVVWKNGNQRWTGKLLVQ